MDLTHLLLLVHIFALGVPMLGLSIFLLVLTIRIRSFLERYGIQRIIFRGILVVGYLFIVIAVMHLAEHVLEWYGYETLSLEAEGVWHAATLLVLLVLAYSFYEYLRTLNSSEKVNPIGEGEERLQHHFKKNSLVSYIVTEPEGNAPLLSTDLFVLKRLRGLPTFPKRSS
jgi:hypothetical protein